MTRRVWTALLKLRWTVHLTDGVPFRTCSARSYGVAVIPDVCCWLICCNEIPNALIFGGVAVVIKGGRITCIGWLMSRGTGSGTKRRLPHWIDVPLNRRAGTQYPLHEIMGSNPIKLPRLTERAKGKNYYLKKRFVGVFGCFALFFIFHTLSRKTFNYIYKPPI